MSVGTLIMKSQQHGVVVHERSVQSDTSCKFRTCLESVQPPRGSTNLQSMRGTKSLRARCPKTLVRGRNSRRVLRLFYGTLMLTMLFVLGKANSAEPDHVNTTWISNVTEDEEAGKVYYKVSIQELPTADGTETTIRLFKGLDKDSLTVLPDHTIMPDELQDMSVARLMMEAYQAIIFAGGVPSAEQTADMAQYWIRISEAEQVEFLYDYIAEETTLLSELGILPPGEELINAETELFMSLKYGLNKLQTELPTRAIGELHGKSLRLLTKANESDYLQDYMDKLNVNNAGPVGDAETDPSVFEFGSVEVIAIIAGVCWALAMGVAVWCLINKRKNKGRNPLQNPQPDVENQTRSRQAGPTTNTQTCCLLRCLDRLIHEA